MAILMRLLLYGVKRPINTDYDLKDFVPVEISGRFISVSYMHGHFNTCGQNNFFRPFHHWGWLPIRWPMTSLVSLMTTKAFGSIRLINRFRRDSSRNVITV